MGCVRLDILDKQYYKPCFVFFSHKKNEEETAVATDHLGSIVAEYSPEIDDYDFFGYDAWGRRYLYDDGGGFGPPHYDYFDDRVPFTVYLSPEEILDFFTRGFTGHEHLDMFGLINMNGRMYDPVIARFLSPDPFVQAPTFTQSFNRYSYVWNNPLSFIDPSGYMTSGFGGQGGGGGGVPTFHHYHTTINGRLYSHSHGGFFDGLGDAWNSFWNRFGGGSGTDYNALAAAMNWHAIVEWWNGMFQAWFNGGWENHWTDGAGDYRPVNEIDAFEGYFSYRYGSGWRNGTTNTGNNSNHIVGTAGAKLFTNANDAYAYMWQNSFLNGVAVRETSGWVLKDGRVIVLPYDKNTLTTSFSDALRLNKSKSGQYTHVQFNGKWHPIRTHVHTHPEKDVRNNNGIGLYDYGSINDRRMFNAINNNHIIILYNQMIYEAWNKNGIWSWRNKGTW